MEILQIPVLNDNYVYLLHGQDDTVVIDPAVPEPVIDLLQTRGWNLTHILNTHHHPDHVGGNRRLIESYQPQVWGCGEDHKRIPGITHHLGDGDKLNLMGEPVEVWFVPGHTLGHIAYYFAKSNVIFVGDTLFNLGCGRLFEGTPEQMWTSLSRIRNLPDDCLVHCAHEYTEANLQFCQHYDPDNPDLQRFGHEVRELRSRKQPTVPFAIGPQKSANLFLRADAPEIMEGLGSGQNASKTFAQIRRLKDRF